MASIFFVKLRAQKGEPNSIAFESEHATVDALTRALGTNSSGVSGKRVTWRRRDPADPRSPRIIVRRTEFTLTGARAEQIEPPMVPFLETEDG